jgi:hypothetical protein
MDMFMLHEHLHEQKNENEHRHGHVYGYGHNAYMETDIDMDKDIGIMRKHALYNAIRNSKCRDIVITTTVLLVELFIAVLVIDTYVKAFMNIYTGR